MYKCECGKEFETPNSFNGHKAHCRVHLLKTGNLDLRKKLQKNFIQKGIESKKTKSELKKLNELTKWIAEKHICEKCGKLMNEKYGSGRFCSRSCANSREQKEETNQKRSNTYKSKLNNFANNKHLKYLNNYNLNPKLCPICNKKINYENRTKNTCGDKNCEHLYRSFKCKLMHLEGRNKGWIKRNTLSFPEKFWMSVLDKNNIKYDKQFKIVWSEKRKYYFLDFLINDKIDLEIDGGQHNLKENIKRDEERDIFVKSLGYIVYRIPWKGLKDKSYIQHQINDLLNFIQDVV